jgi:hypothetical protein
LHEPHCERHRRLFCTVNVAVGHSRICFPWRGIDFGTSHSEIPTTRLVCLRSDLLRSNTNAHSEVAVTSP